MTGANHHLLQGEGLVEGVGVGEAIVTSEAIAFNLGVDETTGMVIEAGHALAGASLAGRVVVCRSGKGSSAGSFSLLQMAARNVAPAAIVADQADAVVTAGCVLAGIPLVHRVRCSPGSLKTGHQLRVNGANGTVQVLA